MEGNLPFHQLPVVVIIKIMSYVPIGDKMVAINVCRDWARLICGVSSIWKYVSIDYNCIFGGDWKEANTTAWLTWGYKGDEKISKMDKFLSELAEVTDSIQHFKIDIPFTLREDSIVRLLTKQKKLLSLILCSASGWKRASVLCLNKEFNARLFEIIQFHQNTLEYLDLSIRGLDLQQWHKYLKAADFPNLRKISYPLKFSEEVPFSKIYTSKDKEELMQCFMQTLKHGKVEEINMETLDDKDLQTWGAVMANALKTQILQGKTKHLKKIPLDFLFVNELYYPKIDSNFENIANDIESLMQQCPELTHLKCHFSKGTIPRLQFCKLIRHYSDQIIYVQCEVTDTIAELISNNCINLTALIVSGHNELTEKGLLAFRKLLKLENLHLKLENKNLISGLVTLLNSCMCNLKQLSLALSRIFYNENKIYSVIGQSSSVLQSLALSTATYMPQKGSTGINFNTFIAGCHKLLSTCSSLKYLSLWISNPFDISWEEETAYQAGDNLLQCIMKYHPMLNTLSFGIEGTTTPSDSLMKHMINCMPYCRITYDKVDPHY